MVAKLVLVVETNFLIASAIEALLAETGYEVVLAIGDAEARAALAGKNINVAIIDFRLQHGDASGLVSHLSTAGVPCIFCTASSTDEVVERFPGARVIEKPFRDTELLAVVAQVVSSQTVAP